MANDFERDRYLLLQPTNGTAVARNDNGSELRQSKASEAVAKVLDASQFGKADPHVKNILTALVQSEIARIPEHELVNMSISQSKLGEIANRVVEDVVGKIPAERQQAIQRGENLKPEEAEMLKASFGLPKNVLAFARADQNGDTSQAPARSSASFDALIPWGSPEYWQTSAGMAWVTSYARSQGLGWAGAFPGLLRMGPEAIKTLAEVHAEKEVYKGLKDVAGCTDKQIVGLASAAKKKDFDFNEAGRVLTNAARGLNKEERERLNGAFLDVPIAKHGPQEEAAFEKFKHVKDKLIVAHPGKKQDLEKAEKFLRNKVMHTHDMESRAEISKSEKEEKAAKADQAEARAKTDVAEKNKLAASIDDLLSEKPTSASATVARKSSAPSEQNKASVIKPNAVAGDKSQPDKPAASKAAVAATTQKNATVAPA